MTAAYRLSAGQLRALYTAAVQRVVELERAGLPTARHREAIDVLEAADYVDHVLVPATELEVLRAQHAALLGVVRALAAGDPIDRPLEAALATGIRPLVCGRRT